MRCILVYAAIAAILFQIVDGNELDDLYCPNDTRCVCGGILNRIINCNIDGQRIQMDVQPDGLLAINCHYAPILKFNNFPRVVEEDVEFKSISLKNCPLPKNSLNEFFLTLGAYNLSALYFEHHGHISGYLNRKHFKGMIQLVRLLLNVDVSYIPSDLFADIGTLQWLTISTDEVELSKELFKPLRKLSALEIIHNDKSNISSDIFKYLPYLRTLELTQRDVTWFTNARAEDLPSLREIDISQHGPSELPSTIFEPVGNLMKLTLFSNKFSSLPKDLLKENKGLENFMIIDNEEKIKDLPERFLADLPNLEWVHIQNIGLRNLPDDLFADSVWIKNITLANNDIESLPESIFENQTKLQSLDLGFNKIKQLKLNLFSTLGCLQYLNMRNNRLFELSGDTFMYLKNLIDLNMESNALKDIPQGILSTNEVGISINFANNVIDFIPADPNNSWAMKTISPFAQINNLKMLNLSHNTIYFGYEDWWLNGPESLDISFNSIKQIWVDERLFRRYGVVMSRGTRNVWIRGNPLDCECRNYLFLDKLKMKIVDVQDVECPMWAKEACTVRFTIFVPLITIIIFLYIVIIIIFIIYRKQIGHIVKTRFQKISHAPTLQKKKTRTVIVKYCDLDEEFVTKNILPTIKCNKAFKIYTNVVKNSSVKCNSAGNLTGCFNDVNKYIDLVIFSTNYLLTTYGQVDIKKIHTEMLKAENTIYIFVDNGGENSVYAFLEEQRDISKTIIWNEINFWEKLFDIISYDHFGGEYMKINDLLKPSNYYNNVLLNANISFSKLPEAPEMNDLDTLKHSQV